jgi:dethiobiotin synthetase
MTVLLISGTDTGVGKTIVTAALAAMARAGGQRVAVVKPVQTGAGPGEPGDLDVVRRLSGVTDLHELARYPEPLAPATAARRAQADPPTVAAIARAVERLDEGDRDLVLVEGAGGLLVQLDADGGTIADVAAALGAPVLLVVRAGLGTLNATALACEVLDRREVPCAGVVIGAWPAEPDLAARCNLDDLPAYANAPLQGRLPAGAGMLDRERFLAVAQRHLNLELGARA